MVMRGLQMILKPAMALLLGLALTLPAAARAQDFSILWWSASVSEALANSSDRRVLANYLDNLPGYDVTYKFSRKRGAFAAHMRGRAGGYDLIVVDSTVTHTVFNGADLDAFRDFFAASGRALMLDGSLWIRNTRAASRTRFPGDSDALAGLLLNQIEALRKAGGGMLIGTDHREFQVGANQVLSTLLPGVKFSGITNPSRDGAFNGKILLNGEARVRPADILRHWETIPNQGEAPVGRFRDFLGNEVVLYSLVDVSDKPGGKRKRSYVSFTGEPGDERYAVDSEEIPEKPDYMPTRKSVVDE